MNDLFLSWVEFDLVLRRLEARTSEPHTIQCKRHHIHEQEKEHQVSVRSHYRYRDYSILNAYLTTE